MGSATSKSDAPEIQNGQGLATSRYTMRPSTSNYPAEERQDNPTVISSQISLREKGDNLTDNVLDHSRRRRKEGIKRPLWWWSLPSNIIWMLWRSLPSGTVKRMLAIWWESGEVDVKQLEQRGCRVVCRKQWEQMQLCNYPGEALMFSRILPWITVM